MLVIQGFSPTMKVPGAYGEVIYGAGGSSAADIPLRVLVVAKKTAAGSAIPDTQVKRIFSASDARAFHGPGSELSNALITGLKVPGVDLWSVAVAEAVGAVAASGTITIAGSWTTNWTFAYEIDGFLFTGTVASTDSVTQAAAKIRDAFLSDQDCPVTATAALGVVTLAAKSKGTSGNRYILVDSSTPASGATSTLAGGSTVPGGGRFLSGGTGTEDVTNVLALINPSKFDRIAIGQVDSTNIGRWKTQVNAQAEVLGNIRQHAVVASNDSLVNATSIAQVTLNAPRFQMAWMVDAESHPSRIAAAMAAKRAQLEQTDPNANFDDVVLVGIAPHRSPTSRPQHSTKVAALNSGVTPITTNDNGEAVIVRSITTKSLNGSNPDYSTLDTGEAVVPDFVLFDLQLLWLTRVKPQNPRIGPRPGPNDKRPPSGMITPDIWDALVLGRLRDFELGKGFPGPLIAQVDQNLPFTEFQSVGGNARHMTAVNVVVAPSTHQVGISVRQQPIAA